MDDLRLPAKKTDEPISTTPQWIPLSGPGSRLPTEDDGDEHGNVWFQVPAMTVPDNSHWSYHKRSGAIAFMPIERRVIPPLPKTVELSQDQKDDQYVQKLWDDQSISARDGIVQALRYGRADGRNQLAQEALALFAFDSSMTLDELANKLDRLDRFPTATAIRRLNELLTEAAR